MRKALLAFTAALLIVALAPRPVAAAVNFNFGIKAGLSLANNVWSDDDGTEKTLARPTFGALAVFNLTPMIAIQPEVNYLVTGEWWNDTIKVVEAFTYIHIPVLVKFRLVKEGKIVPVIFAGPAVSFLLSAKEMGDDVKSFFKSTDFGADLGLGAEFGLGTMKAFVDARYYLGLTNAYNGSPIILTLAPTTFSMKNRAIIITAGLLF